MIVARFGYEAFYVTSEKGIYTIDDLSFEYGKDLEDQGTTGEAKPIGYITAIKLIKSGFTIHLDARFVDVQAKINTWKEMAESSNYYAYSIGGVYIGTNKFVVTDVKESNIKLNGRGKKIKATLDISILEYAGSQSKLTILKKRLADYS